MNAKKKEEVEAEVEEVPAEEVSREDALVKEIEETQAANSRIVGGGKPDDTTTEDHPIGTDPSVPGNTPELGQTLSDLPSDVDREEAVEVEYTDDQGPVLAGGAPSESDEPQGGDHVKDADPTTFQKTPSEGDSTF